MSGDYRISAQDGFAAYCRAYDKTQRKLQESGMPRAVKVEYVARIDGDKVCYCQLATDANIREAESYRREYGGRIVRLIEHEEVPPPTRTEWHVTGYTASGALKSWTTVVTEAERDQAVRDAYRCGCERAEIVAREAAA